MKFTKNEAHTVDLIQSLRDRPSTPERRAKIRAEKRTLRRYRSNIRAAATAQRHGWDKSNRRWRYQALINVYNDDPLPRTAERIDADPGILALAAAGRLLGKVETGYNDAPWLRQMENDLPHDRLDWMIPGQSYCGFGCIWSYWEGAGILLPDGTVYTPNLCPYGGHVEHADIVRGVGVQDTQFSRVDPTRVKPGGLIVFNFGSGGAKHVGLARAPMRNGVIPTREFNTSPSSGGSQSNGGGVWDKNRTRGLILCALNVAKA